MPEASHSCSSSGRGPLQRLTWCRHNPLIAALVVCNCVLIMSGTATSAFFAARYAEVQRENEQLRRELDALRNTAPLRSAR
jgi:hypothetical protein